MSFIYANENTDWNKEPATDADKVNPTTEQHSSTEPNINTPSDHFNNNSTFFYPDNLLNESLW